MANIPLQSITFPGLADKYTTPVVDSTLTQTGAAADAKKTGDEIGAIKNDLNQFPNGNYPQMGAGYANQLVSGLKKEDSTPYNFRKVPYDSTLEDVKKIVGVTTVNNQLVQERTIATVTDGDKSITTTNGKVVIVVSGASGTPMSTVDWCALIASHKYLILVNVPFSVGYQIYFQGYSNTGNGYGYIINYTGTSGEVALKCYVNANATVGTHEVLPMACDLTQAFGTAIADYVYSLETATAGAGVAWLKTHFPAQFDAGYQAYDAGTLKSIEGLSGKKTVGFNQWDEEWEVGGYANATGEPWNTNTRIRSKTTNYIPILPNTDYCFSGTAPFDVYWYDADKVYIEHGAYPNNTVHTSPTNAHFMRFAMYADYGTTYNHDICINFSDPTKNGTYEPYEAHSYALDSDVVLRGIPKLDSNNQLYYDGDEYLPDGTVNRRYGIVDLGTLGWTKNGNATQFYSSFLDNTGVPDVNGSNVKCAKYIGAKSYSEAQTGISVYGTATQTRVWVYDSAYDDATTFKTAMSGVYLVYELATPTTETADPYQTPQIVSPDGTEEYIYEDGAFELPVGHTSDYPVDVSGQLDDILDTPSVNGTYVLKATVTDGAVTYSWVADA